MPIVPSRAKEIEDQLFRMRIQQSLGQLDFVDSQVGWAISMDGSGNVTLYQTLNGGQTWQSSLPLDIQGRIELED